MSRSWRVAAGGGVTDRLRVIGRRAASGSFTVLGDLAQSTTPGGQRSWADVRRHLGAERSSLAELTIGYRVPAPVLEEIASIMTRHPDWSLDLAGFTDSIGSDSANLDLSRRRARE